MTLIKREPRSAWPMRPAFTDGWMDRMFQDMVYRWFATPTEPPADEMSAWVTPMRVEEFADGDVHVIRAELPGIDPDKDVEVTISDGMLHLRAHREERTEEDRPTGYRSEFRYGSFERHIRMPDGATDTDVKAAYKDGILEVRVPMPAPATPEPIAVPVDRG